LTRAAHPPLLADARLTSLRVVDVLPPDDPEKFGILVVEET